MAIRQVGSRVYDLTRNRAVQMYTFKPVPGDRSLKPQRVAYHRQKLEEGKFHSPTWAVARLNGETYRVNGQHSSFMLSECEDFPEGMEVFVLEFECDTAEDLAELHTQFDNIKSVRTPVEKVSAYLRADPALSDICKTNGRLIASGLAFFLNGLTPLGEYTAAGIEKLPPQYPEFSLWANQLVNNKSVRLASIVAAMYETYGRAKEAATEFWTYVRDETHIDRDNPTRKLAKFLLENYSKKGTVKEGTKKWSQEAVYRKCIIAFEAYQRGAKTDLKFYPRKDKKKSKSRDASDTVFA